MLTVYQASSSSMNPRAGPECKKFARVFTEIYRNGKGKRTDRECSYHHLTNKVATTVPHNHWDDGSYRIKSLTCLFTLFAFTIPTFLIHNKVL